MKSIDFPRLILTYPEEIVNIFSSLFAIARQR